MGKGLVAWKMIKWIKGRWCWKGGRGAMDIPSPQHDYHVHHGQWSDGGIQAKIGRFVDSSGSIERLISIDWS